MTQILLPLRSNAGWFHDQNTRSKLEYLIKNYMLIYDEVIFQNARYMCTIGENGSIDLMIPTNSIDRTKIKYFVPGESFKLLIGPSGETPTNTLLDGPAVASYEVDYYPIINDAGLLNEKYFGWLQSDIQEEDKKLAQKEIQNDRIKLNKIDNLPNNHFQKKKIIEAFYFDSLFAFRLNIPFLVYRNIFPLIKMKNEEAKQRWLPSLNDTVYDNWLQLGLPDLGKSSWKDIHELRESLLGEDFRRMIERISVNVSSEITNIKNVEDIKILLSQEFSKELINEISALLKTDKELVFNTMLNFVPYGSIISSAADFIKIFNERKSWVSLLSKNYTL